MKKNGRHEKQAVAPAAKQSIGKSMMLRTYLTSLLSLVLCVTMFFGVSFAWFTSEVNNVGNEIYIGTLAVGLEKKVGDAWNSLSAVDATTGVNTTKLFDSTSIRWEPGYTALETIQVVNKGNLAFKYELTFTDGSISGGAKTLADVAACFDVWSYYHAGNAAPTLGTYNDISEDNGWKKVGTLKEALDGEIVLNGSMNKDAVANSANTAHTYTIALHMNEGADSSVMGHKIGLNVKLVAYQLASEADGIGNKYDQMVSTEEQLKEAVANGGTVALAADIELTETLSIASNKTVTLHLNGHTLSQSKECTESYSMISNNGNLTITGNGRISFTDTSEGDPSFGWGSYTIRNDGTLVVENGTIEHLGAQNVAGQDAKHMYCAIYQYSGSTTINGGTISTPNYRSARLWTGDMTINGGTFTGQLWVQTVGSAPAALTINGGNFSPAWNDASSVFVGNDANTCTLKVTGGTFNGKIGVSNPGAEGMSGCITGGQFTGSAKENTHSGLFAD